VSVRLIKGTLLDMTGTAIAGQPVVCTLSSPIDATTADVVVPLQIEQLTDVNGLFSFSLFAQADLKSSGSTYTISLPRSPLSFAITVPSGAYPVGHNTYFDIVADNLIVALPAPYPVQIVQGVPGPQGIPGTPTGSASLSTPNLWTAVQTMPLIDKGGQVFNVAAYGTVGNADDSATFNAAITAAAVHGGTVTWDYAATTTAAIVVKPGVHLIGQGRGISKITNTTSDVFNDSAGAWAGQSFSDFSVIASGGHIFTTANVASVTSWDRLRLSQGSTTKSIFNIAGMDGSQIWRSWLTSSVNRSVPLVSITTTTGDLNGNDIGGLWIQDTGTPTTYQIEVNAGGGGFAQGNHIHDIVSENALGGVIHAYQVIGLNVSDVSVWDLAGAPSNNLIHVDTAGANTNVTVKNYSRTGGGVLAVYDINFTGVYGGVVDGATGGGSGPIKINADQYCSGVVASGIGTNVTLSAGGSVVWDQVGTPTGLITSALTAASATFSGNVQAASVNVTYVQDTSVGGVYIQPQAAGSPLVIHARGGGGVSIQPATVLTLGAGFWNHAAPGSQPAAPVTLADVIAIIRGCGLSA
jgi:hypothetical protein